MPAKPSPAKTHPKGRADGQWMHAHRTAKIVELVSSSTRSFEDAIKNAVKDAAMTTRGLSGAHVQNMSVRIQDGKIVEYKVNLNVAFGIERTGHP
ncbi:MAG TPA: dodecin family protein [Candidatus Thermoplasmatota archaeon]|nr:dodecin family protein [Candidatus Thermoplasmatota archaeon]